MATIKDIARMSGYSIGTVSRVINKRTDVSDQAREKIEEIIGKYQKREAKLLNYLIVDDEITFFLPLSDDEKISDDDLAKISELITGEYIQTESINQEYRIKFKYGL